MSILKKLALPLGIALALALAAPGTSLAASCKEMSQSKCDKSDSCSWVNGYKTKSGTKVKGYCRNKAKSSSDSKDKKDKKDKKK